MLARGIQGLAVYHLPASLSQLAGAEPDWQTTTSQETEEPLASSQKSYHTTQTSITGSVYIQYIAMFSKLLTKPSNIWPYVPDVSQSSPFLKQLRVWVRIAYLLLQNVLLAHRHWCDEDIVTYQTEHLTMMTPAETLTQEFFAHVPIAVVLRSQGSPFVLLWFRLWDIMQNICISQGVLRWLTHTYILYKDNNVS